jgi:hypothetical protein
MGRIGDPMDDSAPIETTFPNDSNSSGVSWGAVIAGAFVAAALSLALLALGTGVGLSAASPWANAGASSSAIGWTAILWMVVMQFIASSIGGYLAGRLRTKWVNVHTHEVYFRDTAHGFLVWAVGLVITAAFLTSAAASMIGGAARSTTIAEASGSAQPVASIGLNGYFVDSFLRTSSPSSTPINNSVREEIGLILLHSLRGGSMSPSDKSYLSQIVAAQTGLNPHEAEDRVDSVYAQAQQAADTARKALAHSMYWTFLALLVGAFCASFAATIGGKQRDHVVVI